MNATFRTEDGFTLIETLISTVVMITVTAGVMVVLHPSHGLFRTQPEVADIQQRLRAGVDTLRHDLGMAGAGAYSGTQSGGLTGYFAPILPFRSGSSSTYDDGPAVFKPDAVTILYVPASASQATISGGMSNADSVSVNGGVGCPAGDLLCGFRPGKTVVVFDGTGAFDTFSVTDADAGGTLGLRHLQRGDLSRPYAAGSKIAEVVQHTYFIDRADSQLMRYDGLSAASVVLDNVVGLDFEYYGEPEPPIFRNPAANRSVTYGPAPPALGVAQSPWPPGENCTWQASGGEHVTRLSAIGTGLGLVTLTAAQLTDGPWCPDAGSPNRYDADLLRIRKVRVTIRMQTGNAALRGPFTAGPDALFVNPGTATSAAQSVVDQSVRFDVSPRNMNLGR